MTKDKVSGNPLLFFVISHTCNLQLYPGSIFDSHQSSFEILTRRHIERLRVKTLWECLARSPENRLSRSLKGVFRLALPTPAVQTTTCSCEKDLDIKAAASAVDQRQISSTRECCDNNSEPFYGLLSQREECASFGLRWSPMQTAPSPSSPPTSSSATSPSGTPGPTLTPKVATWMGRSGCQG